MRIAFDGAPLEDGNALGVATAFLTGLAAYARAWPGEAILLLPEGVADPGVPHVQLATAPRSAWARQWELPRLLRRHKAQVLHSPVAAVPLLARTPTIATVHDLPWLSPGGERDVPARRRRATAWSLRRATIVLAPSQFTFDAARALVPRQDRLRLLPHATPLPSEPPPSPARRQGPLLALGDDRPRKNRARLLQALEIARARCPDLPDLCLVGPPFHRVSDEEKARLLRGCRALLHVSTFEGFGLPVLEGLAHGIPTLCSDLPPHREIAGDAALYAPFDDVWAMAAGIVAVATDEALRQRLADAGPPRARRHRPEDLAAAWRRLHEELAQ
jgi:glycosyltransferase involved in cell wall biosynthesis